MAVDKSKGPVGDRDSVIAEMLKSSIKSSFHAESHLGDIKSNKIVRPRYWSEVPPPRASGVSYWSDYNAHTFNPTADRAITMVMAPAWGIVFPPYNVARLTAVMRKYNYKVQIHDVNIECKRWIDKNKPFGEDFVNDLWEGINSFKWFNPYFNDNLLKGLQPFLNQKIDDIIAEDTSFIAVSYTHLTLPTSREV